MTPSQSRKSRDLRLVAGFWLGSSHPSDAFLFAFAAQAPSRTQFAWALEFCSVCCGWRFWPRPNCIDPLIIRCSRSLPSGLSSVFCLHRWFPSESCAARCSLPSLPVSQTEDARVLRALVIVLIPRPFLADSLPSGNSIGRRKVTTCVQSPLRSTRFVTRERTIPLQFRAATLLKRFMGERAQPVRLVAALTGLRRQAGANQIYRVD